ncbi:MAG TPA: tRNA lysidine(34) synthetase TilS [Gemmatimonadales bacterium]|nr:tRNA lysidine(34) synthetase TilS [Gemmatimonadales bacterium]
MSLDTRLLATLERLRPAPGPALLAVSGGVDSMVLLDLLARTRDAHRLPLIVAHVDHGIHPASAVPAALVAARAQALGLPLVQGQLGLGGGCSETTARRARYAWLRAERARLGARWIVTAHHADDQRETVLMRALRGSGPAGLAGMAPRQGALLRPLLGVSRRSLLGYAGARGLEWWEDPANADFAHLRSWLRAQVVPLLQTRLPDLGRRLGQTRRHAARHREAWQAALRHWPGLAVRRERGGGSLALDVVAGLPPALGLTLVEGLLRRVGAPVSPGRLQRALPVVLAGGSGARAPLGQGWNLERAFERLVVVPPVLAEPAGLQLTPPEGRADWGPWHLQWSLDVAPARQARDGATAWFIPGGFVIRGWRAGDRLAPLGGTGHRLAVRCFQDARVPRGERGQWPLIEGQGRLAWIPGVCRSRDLVPEPGAPALRIDVQPGR